MSVLQAAGATIPPILSSELVPSLVDPDLVPSAEKIVPSVEKAVPSVDPDEVPDEVTPVKSDGVWSWPSGRPGGGTGRAKKPHIIVSLQDDLGWTDAGFTMGLVDNRFKALEKADEYTTNHLKAIRRASRHLSQLAKNGLTLGRHYAHYHCSPSRRSFLTGRLPLHHGEELSLNFGDDIDLRMTTIGQKMKTAGYKTYYYGKGHTGFLSTAHLPINQGFDSHVGFLSGQTDYVSHLRWKDHGPYQNSTYSTILFGDLAVRTVRGHDKKNPLFMFISWQNVHIPLDTVPDLMMTMIGSKRACTRGFSGDDSCGRKCKGCNFANMLAGTDYYMEEITDALKVKGMWDDTLILYASDNGGAKDGCNYPFRGEKNTNYEGGIRVAAFLSGGFLPKKVRGTHSNLVSHISDWYPTFCALAGVSKGDGAPAVREGKVPQIDGVDLWPFLSGKQASNDSAAAHKYLWVTKQVLIKGDYKLLTAQPSRDIFDDPVLRARGELGEVKKHGVITSGWKHPNGQMWFDTKASLFSTAGVNRPKRDEDSTDDSGCAQPDVDGKDWAPCLYNVATDAAETTNLATRNEGIGDELRRELKKLNAPGYWKASSPAHLVQRCTIDCSKKTWKMLAGMDRSGPFCGLEQCTGGNNYLGKLMGHSKWPECELSSINQECVHRLGSSGSSNGNSKVSSGSSSGNTKGSRGSSSGNSNNPIARRIRFSRGRSGSGGSSSQGNRGGNAASHGNRGGNARSWGNNRRNARSQGNNRGGNAASKSNNRGGGNSGVRGRSGSDGRSGKGNNGGSGRRRKPLLSAVLLHQNQPAAAVTFTNFTIPTGL